MTEAVTQSPASPPPAAPTSESPLGDGNTLLGNQPAPVAADTPPAPTDKAEPPAADPPKEPEAAPAPLTAESFKLPEGAQLSPEALGDFVKVANDAGIKPEFAQQFLDIGAKLLQQQAAASIAEGQKLNESWAAEIKNNPINAGSKLTENLAAISKVIDSFGDPGLRDALNLTGAGNHPAIFNTFLKISQALGEGKPATGSPPASAPKDLASIMYPSQQG